MDILEALLRLDHSNDDHWTSDGLPRVDAVREILGDESITRAQITAADPAFRREVSTEGAEDESEVEENIENTEPENINENQGKNSEESKDEQKTTQDNQEVTSQIDLDIAEVDFMIDSIKQKQAELASMLSENEQKRDELYLKKNSEFPSVTPQEAARSYIENSQKSSMITLSADTVKELSAKLGIKL